MKHALVPLLLLVYSTPLTAQAADAERVRMPSVNELEAEGYHSLFNGKDLTGWTIPEGDNGHWKVVDGVIDYDARSEAKGNKSLFSEKEYSDYTLYFEWRFKRTSGLYPMPTILPDGSYKTDTDGKRIVTPTPNADSGLLFRPGHQANLWCWSCGSGELWSVRNNKNATPRQRADAVPKANADKPVGQWNRMMAHVVGDRVTIVLNGLKVIDNAQLPDLEEQRGPIGFQHHGGPLSPDRIESMREQGMDVPDNAMSPASSLVQFRNIYIKAHNATSSRENTAAPDDHENKRGGGTSYSFEEDAFGTRLLTPDGRTILRYMTRKPPQSKLAANSVCCLFPVNTPSGTRMVDFAPSDHPHHRGIFLAWHAIDGPIPADFWGWGEWAPTKGRIIVNRNLTPRDADARGASFTVNNQWLAEDRVLMDEQSQFAATEIDGVFVIDAQYSLTPTTDLTIRHTAFGGFCVKARKDGQRMYLDASGRVGLPSPHHLKPETDWPARDWYAFQIDLENGKRIGIAVVDHPENPPTRWHNVKAISMINPCIAALGPFKMPAGKAVTLRYRLIVHDGPTPSPGITKLAEDFRGETP